jgi:hypothetical protein
VHLERRVVAGIVSSSDHLMASCWRRARFSKANSLPLGANKKAKERKQVPEHTNEYQGRLGAKLIIF